MAFDLVYASELERVLNENRSVLIDVRMKEDYRKDHWPKAVNYSYGDIAEGVIQLPRNRYIILYCEHGGSSMQLARSLGKEGYRVATVVGGFEAMAKVRAGNKKVYENYFKNV